MEDTGSPTLTGVPSDAAPISRRRSLVIASAVLLMVLIGWVDHATGWELSLFVFYAVPLLMVVWQDEKRLAVVIALMCGAIWWLANRADHPYRLQWNYHWASLGRTAYFVLVAVGGNAIRARQQADRALIEALNKMRQLEHEVVKAGEHEQQRIGRDLHDGLCQQLAAICCAARSLADDLRSRGLPEAAKAGEIEELLSDSVGMARDLSRGICPVFSGGAELETALEELAHRASHLTGIHVSFRDGSGAQMVGPEAAVHLYRIAQEALNNALRHSHATRVDISLYCEGETVRLTVADNGTVPPGQPWGNGGMGMKTMEYRSHALGGTLEIQRLSPGGTLVSCVCNIKKQLHDGDKH